MKIPATTTRHELLAFRAACDTFKSPPIYHGTFKAEGGAEAMKRTIASLVHPYCILEWQEMLNWPEMGHSFFFGRRGDEYCIHVLTDLFKRFDRLLLPYARHPKFATPIEPHTAAIAMANAMDEMGSSLRPAEGQATMTTYPEYNNQQIWNVDCGSLGVWLQVSQTKEPVDDLLELAKRPNTIRMLPAPVFTTGIMLADGWLEAIDAANILYLTPAQAQALLAQALHIDPSSRKTSARYEKLRGNSAVRVRQIGSKTEVAAEDWLALCDVLIARPRGETERDPLPEEIASRKLAIREEKMRRR